MSLFIAIAALALLLLFWTIVMILKAPEGYEDENGFHYGAFPKRTDAKRWSPKVGQVGSLPQSHKQDSHVEETSSAYSRSESESRSRSPER